MNQKILVAALRGPKLSGRLSKLDFDAPSAILAVVDEYVADHSTNGLLVAEERRLRAEIEQKLRSSQERCARLQAVVDEIASVSKQVST